MKLLVVGINYAPDIIGIAKYTTEMCEWYAARGHEVQMVTALPYYPEWVVPSEYRRWRYHGEMRNSVKILRTPIYVPTVPTGVRRLLHLLSFAVLSFPVLIMRAILFRPDVVIAIAPALSSAPVARFAAALCGAKSWIHIQDFEVDAAFDLGLLNNRMLRTLALMVEKWVLLSFARVSTISPQMLKLLQRKGCLPSRTVELRNWVDPSIICPEVDGECSERRNRFRDMLDMGKQDILVLYAGNISHKQGIEIVVDVARMHEGRSDIKYLVVGDGPGKESLMKSAAALTNVFFLSLQPIEYLNELLNAADIHLLPQLPGAADLVLPSKLTGMFASGRPVIATAEPGTGLADEVRERGIVVRTGDVAELGKAILDLAGDSQRRNQLGSMSRLRAVEVFSKERILQRMEADLTTMIT